MTDNAYADWEAVIGLEVHVQLNTRTKLFSRAPNRFGNEPNTNIGLVDTAQPGTLPILNKEAVNKAIRLGCAIDAEVSPFSAFDRKSYFYPDSPRNFQITQFYHPIIKGGRVLAEVDGQTKEFGISHAHLEDDSGMLKHFSNFAGVDYNRAGVPLIEVVSEPCMRSAKEASAYAQALRAILIYLDVSNCNMEEGSMRIDTNISVRKKGEMGLRNKIEIKNLNSFMNMELAIECEIKRQIALYTSSPDIDPKELIKSSTYRYDVEKNITVAMRSKELADDYRYFPEPDLPPLFITADFIEKIRRNLPELPHQRYDRYTKKLELSAYQAALLVNDKPLSDYFELALKDCKNPKALCNWITVEFTGRLKEMGKTVMESGVRSEHIGSLVALIEDKVITGKIAKSVADEMVLQPGVDPRIFVDSNPLFQTVSDTGQIETAIDQILSENPQSKIDYNKGIAKAYNFLFGQVMKVTQGKADPELVKDILLKKLQS